MIASLKSISEILGKPGTRYLIPVFQRVYSWDRMQCEQLWNDMMKADSGSDGHFTGTFIYRPETERAHGGFDAATECAEVSLIDGQQRLTTLTLMLVALRDGMRDAGDTAGQTRSTRRICIALPIRPSSCSRTPMLLPWRTSSMALRLLGRMTSPSSSSKDTSFSRRRSRSLPPTPMPS